jgi:hypothetical protein
MEPLPFLTFGSLYNYNPNIKLDEAEYTAKDLIKYNNIMLTINNVNYHIIDNILSKIDPNQYRSYLGDLCYVTKIIILNYFNHSKLYFYCGDNSTRNSIEILNTKDDVELFLTYLLYNDYVSNIKISNDLFAMNKMM